MAAYIAEMIQISIEESHLLSTLQSKAKSIAAHFSDAMEDRLSKLPEIQSAPDPQSLYQDLFINLFNDSWNENNDEDECASIPVLLAGIDVIIDFGHAVAEYSTKPNQASRAFNKALARMILKRQFNPSTQPSYLYDLMLLD